jgi:hypothetical protein
MQNVQNIQYGYLLNKYLKGAGLVAWEATEYMYSGRTESVNVATNLSSTQEVISHLQVTDSNIAWILQCRIHK